MLSRIGNSLFWMGRYLERAEHIARYMRVQYMAGMDAPLAQSNAFTLESMLCMAGVHQNYTSQYGQPDEEKAIGYLTIADENPFSIKAYTGHVRENARGARDSISSELWERINQYYHTVNQFTPEKLRTEGLYQFAQKIEESSYVIKGYIDNTLLRNDVWLLITLGVHLERAAQVIQILKTKLRDIEQISKQGGPLENYLWTTVLLSVQARDMYLRHHRSSPNRLNVLDFLVCNSAFPKSVAYNLAQVKQNIGALPFPEQKNKSSISFMAGKLASRFEYLTANEVAESPSDFLDDTLAGIYELARLLEEKYLNYDMVTEASYYDYTIPD